MGRSAVPASQSQATSPQYTYSAVAVAATPAATATDFLTLTGSASRTIKVLRWRVAVSVTAGSASPFDVQLVKRSAANTGGTATTPTAVPWDSTFPAAGATARLYSANPTLGTPVGALRALRATTTTGTGQLALLQGEFELVDPQHGPVVLRGAAEVLALNFNGASPANAVVTSEVVWTEE